VGYLAKSSILPFLALYPLVFWFFTDLKPKNYLLVFLLLFAAILVAHFLPRAFLPDVQRVNSYIENPLYFEKSFWLRIGTGLVSLLFYLRILIYPHPLIYYYGYDMIPVVTPLNIWAILSFLILAGLFLYALYKFREKHILSFSILWFLVAISMYSNIVMPVVGIVGERFVFIASLGFCIALVYLVFRIFKTDPKSLTIEFDARAKVIVVMALLLIPSTALTITRNREWRNPYDLYRKDIKYQAKSAKANTQYAGHLMNMALKDPNFMQSGVVNQFLEQTIISYYRRALDIYPASYQTVNDLGSVYLFFAKNPDSAIYFLNKALEMRPELIPARVNLGMAYREKGDYPKAIENYESILKINPREVRAIFALANVYFDMGDVAKAVKMNEDVMATNPQLDMPYINLGNYAIQKGDTARAVGYYEQALQRRPTYEGFMQLSYLYKIHGDMERAAFYQQQAQQLTNASPKKRPLLK
jgi:tetratricopeptide (TPR) repeat protein